MEFNKGVSNKGVSGEIRFLYLTSLMSGPRDGVMQSKRACGHIDGLIRRSKELGQHGE